MLKLTPELWKKIQDINSDRNDRIQYVGDKVHYGKPDWWAFPDDDDGDCEDIGIAKQFDLTKEGIPSFLATCWCYPTRPILKRGYHAVDVVPTDYGWFILDNRFPNVYDWEKSDYLWHKIEREDETWRKIIV